jgi:hypothetical protein
MGNNFMLLLYKTVGIMMVKIMQALYSWLSLVILQLMIKRFFTMH